MKALVIKTNEFIDVFQNVHPITGKCEPDL